MVTIWMPESPKDRLRVWEFLRDATTLSEAAAFVESLPQRPPGAAIATATEAVYSKAKNIKQNEEDRTDPWVRGHFYPSQEEACADDTSESAIHVNRNESIALTTCTGGQLLGKVNLKPDATG